MSTKNALIIYQVHPEKCNRNSIISWQIFLDSCFNETFCQFLIKCFSSIFHYNLHPSLASSSNQSFHETHHHKENHESQKALPWNTPSQGNPWIIERTAWCHCSVQPIEKHSCGNIVRKRPNKHKNMEYLMAMSNEIKLPWSPLLRNPANIHACSWGICYGHCYLQSQHQMGFRMLPV